MDSKKMVWLGFFVGSTAGSLLGSAFDGHNFIGFWSFAVGTVGGLLGIWAGYKMSQ